MATQSAAWWGAWPYHVLFILLLAAAYTDVRQGKIPNYLTYPGVLVGLVGHTVMGRLTGQGGAAVGLAGSAAGLAVGFLPLMVAWRIGVLGGGDAKMMGAVGALTGWRFALAAMFYGMIAMVIMAFVVMIAKRVTRRTLGRMWRTVVLLFAPGGTLKPPAGADSPTVPIGLAFCLGAGAALIEVLWRGPVAGKLALGL